jgi:hypothetical protein
MGKKKDKKRIVERTHGQILQRAARLTTAIDNSVEDFSAAQSWLFLQILNEYIQDRLDSLITDHITDHIS